MGAIRRLHRDVGLNDPTYHCLNHGEMHKPGDKLKQLLLCSALQHVDQVVGQARETGGENGKLGECVIVRVLLEPH